MIELARTMPPPSPRRVRPDVPRALDAVCVKAMAHRPADRYAGALALAEDVQRYLAGAPVSAYREPWPARAWRWCKRHRRALTRAAAAAAALAVVVATAAGVREVLRKAEEDVREAQRDAEYRRRRDQARDDFESFCRLAEERHIRAPNTTPAGQALRSEQARSSQYFNSARGQEKAKAAVDLANRLGKELDELDLRAERGTLDKELHDLLLVMAHERTRQPERNTAADVLATLERAVSKSGPSRSYHRLRARCYHALGEESRAVDEEERARAVSPTALDHFIQAEEHRTRAFEPVETSGDDLSWRPNRDLLRKAVAEYHLAVRGEPENFWYHLQLGRCYLSLDQGAEALEVLSTCVALRPKEPWGYSARGLTQGLIKRYAEGEADLDRALAIDSGFRPARLHRGLLALLQRKDEQALEDFAKVLEPGEGRLIEAAYYRGQLRLLRMEYAKALADFDLVVNEDAGFRPAYLSRAQAHFLREDTSRGLADLAKFLDLGRPSPFDPNDPALFAARGRLLLQLIPKWRLPPEAYLAKLPLARQDLEAARKRGHRSAELFDDLGSVAERLGEYDQALDAYAESLKLNGPLEVSVKVHTKRGWIFAAFLRKPQYERAREEFVEAIRLGPAHANAHAGLGFVRAIQRAPGEAVLAAGRAHALGADDYLILHNVACVYAELSRADKGWEAQHQDAAMDVLRRAVRLCRQGGDGDDEIKLIQGDSSLRVLEGHPGYRALIAGEGSK